MAKNRKTNTLGAELRRAERAIREDQDPWFGKRRPSGEMGARKSKAARDKAACRGRWA